MPDDVKWIPAPNPYWVCTFGGMGDGGEDVCCGAAATHIMTPSGLYGRCDRHVPGGPPAPPLAAGVTRSGQTVYRGGAGGEVRVTDPKTGGQKGSKPAQLGAIDPMALIELANVAGFGTKKYDTWNYVKGFKWSLSYHALQRHLMLFWNGEARDPESGLPHLAHAAWHCLALLTFSTRGRGTDDRIGSVL